MWTHLRQNSCNACIGHSIGIGNTAVATPRWPLTHLGYYYNFILHVLQT